MSVQELNGWAPSSVTLGPDGEVLSVTVTEPRFTLADKAALLASFRADREPRGRHGILLSEAMDPANQGRFEVPMPPNVDWAQDALNRAQAQFQAQWPDEDLDSRMWSVRLSQTEE